MFGEDMGNETVGRFFETQCKWQVIHYRHNNIENKVIFLILVILAYKTGKVPSCRLRQVRDQCNPMIHTLSVHAPGNIVGDLRSMRKKDTFDI